MKNSQTDSKKTIEDIIIKKSGRLVKNDKLYLVIRDFLVYVKSLKITLETVYVPGPVELPDKDKYLTSEFTSNRYMFIEITLVNHTLISLNILLFKLHKVEKVIK